MSNLSVIIPSKTVSNIVRCVSAILTRDHGHRILVIDDGLAPNKETQFIYDHCTVLQGTRPFIFSRAINEGIAASGEDDIVILGDDGLLESPSGFTSMQRAAQEHPEYGIISARTNLSGYPVQTRARYGLWEADMVAFICVLVPRRVINSVGLMDERYTDYGFEDNDYCRQVRNTGFKIGVLGSCFVDHRSLPSTFRPKENPNPSLEPGRKIYLDKWGSYAKGDPR